VAASALPQGQSIQVEMDARIVVRSSWHSPLVNASKTSKYEAISLAASAKIVYALASAYQDLLKSIS
jgi:hypothetical protein